MTGNAPSATTPAVTIGMPVYNGARFLRAALDSLLGQTFADFHLVISDNASSDGTEAICREYAARDARIRYVRQSANLGAVANWNFVARQATGTFFKWASANDVCAPGMLAAYVDVLRREPQVVLCYGRTMLVDENDAHLGVYDHDPSILDRTADRRFTRAITELRMNNAQAGLIRTSALQRTRLEPAYPAGDMVLMAELALLGGYRLLPDVLLYRRMSADTFAARLSSAQLAEFIAPSRSPQRMPVWRRLLGYASAALRSPVSLSEKSAALAFVLRYAVWIRAGLWQELAEVLRPWGHRESAGRT